MNREITLSRSINTTESHAIEILVEHGVKCPQEKEMLLQQSRAVEVIFLLTNPEIITRHRIKSHMTPKNKLYVSVILNVFKEY